MAQQDLVESPVKELLRRFFITFILGVVTYRLGVFVPIPGVDAEALRGIINGGLGGDSDPLKAMLAYANMFNGGAIQHASIFGLGITPYISASIIIQLMTFSIPALKALQKEGESGRRRINQYTRYLTLVIALVQSLVAAIALSKGSGGTVLLTTEALAHTTVWFVQSVAVITTGSMLILWIADQITRFGIGNGVSIVIMVSIMAGMPGAFGGHGTDLGAMLGMILVCLLIIAAIIVVVQAVRRVNLEQQRRVQGNRVYGGAQTTLPLKLNQANVIPVIFAQPVIVLLVMLAATPLLDKVGLGQFMGYGNPGHRLVYAALIVAFTYFYISITFDLNDLTNHFKQAGFFVRGIKPGKNTADHVGSIMTRITFVGAIFLAIISILPETLAASFGMSGQRTVLLGGTGLLIIVGVLLDVMQKVGSFMLAHKYGGAGAAGGLGSGKKAGKRF